jgi:hypothetical protein
MEVFHMNTYETYQVRYVGYAVRGGPSAYWGRHEPARYKRHDWDYVVRMVCTGCGKGLGRFEIRNHLAFCHRCRMYFFPETVWPDEGRSRRALDPW